MPRPAHHSPLNVYLNSRLVGRFNRSTSGAVDFRYDPKWLNWNPAIPVSLSLPLQEDRYIGAPVVAVFDNLLPDNDDIRRQVALRVHAEGADTFNLLAALGRDCIGALQFLPLGTEPGPAGAVAGEPLDDKAIATLLENLATSPLGLGADEDFRISLAGAQEKTALLRWNDRWHKPLRATATTHILKPQIGKLPGGIDFTNSVENEYLCLKLTAALGLPSAPVEMQTFAGRRVLVVERFDRRWTADGRLLRRPQEDCCQALSISPSRKYEKDGGPGIAAILDLLKASDDPAADRKAFLKAIVVFWLLGATDGHAKNFSLHLGTAGRFRLAPLYDVLTTQPQADAGQIARNRVKLAMAVGDTRHYIVDRVAPRHFRESAAQSGVAATVMDEIFAELAAAAPGALAAVTQALPKSFPAALVTSVLRGFQSRLRQLVA